MKMAELVLVLAVTGAPVSQIDTPGPRDSQVGKSSTASFSGCGLIFEGKDSCPRLFRSDGVAYRLDNYEEFSPGETVTVTGVLDSSCVPGCVEPEACIRENTIIAGCHPNPVAPSTWGLIKARYR